MLDNPLVLIDPDGRQVSVNPLFAAGVGSGVWSSVKGSVTGLWAAVTHPIETARGLHALATDPVVQASTVAAVVDAARDRVEKLRSGDPFAQGEVFGEALAVVGEAVVGTKGLGAVTRTARLTRAVGTTAEVAEDATVVYRSVNAAPSAVRRPNQQSRSSGCRASQGKGIQIEKVLGGLSRTDARAVEQALIEIHGLGRNGGTLLNRINSIAKTNAAYAGQVERGYEILQSIGYR